MAMFWRRKRSVNDFQEEIRAHLELEAEALKQEGLSEREARLAAKKAFGTCWAPRNGSMRRTACAGWTSFHRICGTGCG